MVWEKFVGKIGEYWQKRNEEGRMRRDKEECRKVVWGEFVGKIGEY